MVLGGVAWPVHPNMTNGDLQSQYTSSERGSVSISYETRPANRHCPVALQYQRGSWQRVNVIGLEWRGSTNTYPDHRKPNLFRYVHRTAIQLVQLSMELKRILCLALLFGCLNANAALTNAGILYVSPSGNDTTARTGQSEFPYLTLTNAFAHLAVSNTVFMMPGTFNLGTNRLKLLTGCSLIGTGPTSTRVLSSVLGANDDIRPTIVLHNNTTVANFTLTCVTNGGDLSNNPDHWQAIGNRSAIGDPAGFTNYYIADVCFENPMIDLFYIGEDDASHTYSGVINNCYTPRNKPAHWDMIAMGGANSLHVLNNCTFYAGMRNASEATFATFVRVSGSAQVVLNNCFIQWTNVIQNASGAQTYAPFILESGVYTAGGRLFLNGGAYVAFVGNATTDVANELTNVLGSFSYSTDGLAFRQVTPSSGTEQKLARTKTSNYTVMVADTGVLFNNSGAAGAVTNTLPAAIVGLHYGLDVETAQNFAFKAIGTDTIRSAGTASAAAGLIFSSTVGGTVHITCNVAGKWVVDSLIGSWSVQ